MTCLMDSTQRQSHTDKSNLQFTARPRTKTLSRTKDQEALTYQHIKKPRSVARARKAQSASHVNKVGVKIK